jgi:hypothetical protein
MRELCPICGNGTVDSIPMNFEVPDGWPLPKENWWNLCRCGFVWLSNSANEENYNEYYKKCYVGANYHDETPHRERLWALARFINERFPKETSIMDYGGGNGRLGKCLKEYGFDTYAVCDVDDEIPIFCDLIVASHVIEHVYDLNKMMEMFKNTTNQVIVELPEALAYSYRTEPPMLDYQTQHINHFGISQLDRLFSNYDFSCEYRENLEFPLLNMPTYRAVYKSNGHQEMFDRIRKFLSYPALTPIGSPVIVYGLGDFCMWVLANWKFDIASFVDDSPQYRGMTIKGKPILDHIEGDFPILVIARGKQKELVEHIKSLGVKNEIIVL